MERANLEALEEESISCNSGTEDEDDEGGNGGMHAGEPNKFESLCDGVTTQLALVHAAMKELLDLKDELLTHALPPNVQSCFALTISKAFRSIGDMHMPVTELTRLVKIYSTPWEEKSVALKKLHEDYEAKKSMLNVAIRRLQLVDTQSKRMAREKRIMNWEKVFCRLTAAKGHGRRWKFLIDGFKKKAKEGLPELQQYLDEMERESNSEDEEEGERVNVERTYDDGAGSLNYPSADAGTQPSQFEPTEEALSSSDEDSDGESTDTPSEPETLSKQGEAPPAPVRPPTKDRAVWTHEPDYDRFLFVKCFTPEGLEQRDLRCVLTCGKQINKSGIMDPVLVVETPKPADVVKANVAVNSSGRSRGLIGRRGTDPSQSPDSTQPSVKTIPRFEEFLFPMPEVETPGVWRPNKSTVAPPEHLQIAVHQGEKEEMVAMATIDMDDLDTLDLPSVILPLDPDSADDVTRGCVVLDNDSVLFSEDGDSVHLESVPSVGDNAGLESPGPDAAKSMLPERLRGLHPVRFPLYSIHGGRGDAVHVPSGQLPLVCVWAKRLKPSRYNRATESETVRDIVLDVTGLDMELVTKESLHKDTVERAVSVMSIHSEKEIKEETVLRSDYDRLMATHREEMEMLQEEYEQRIEELAECLEEMQMARLAAPPRTPPSPHNGRSRSPYQPSPQPPSKLKGQANESAKSRKNFRVGRTLPIWGENLPKDFFERLQFFEELRRKTKEEFSTKTNKEIQEHIERRLAGEFKLRPDGDPDINHDHMQDVSLPAVFMPSKGRDLTIFNPRAAKFFHATGSGGLRLTQPPSMIQLPPLHKNKVSIVNLFNVGQGGDAGGTSEWLMQRYMDQREAGNQAGNQTGNQADGRDARTPLAPAPAPTFVSQPEGVQYGDSPGVTSPQHAVTSQHRRFEPIGAGDYVINGSQRSPEAVIE